MSIKFRIYCIPLIFYLFTQIGISSRSIESTENLAAINSTEEPNEKYINEKRASPAYDAIIGVDGLPHYRVLFWVPKEAKKFYPYSENNVKTDVSEHGPVEMWSVKETNTTNKKEKLVYILVPKTFVYLYGKGFEKVIHLKYA